MFQKSIYFSILLLIIGCFVAPRGWTQSTTSLRPDVFTQHDAAAFADRAVTIILSPDRTTSEKLLAARYLQSSLIAGDASVQPALHKLAAAPAFIVVLSHADVKVHGVEYVALLMQLVVSMPDKSAVLTTLLTGAAKEDFATARDTLFGAEGAAAVRGPMLLLYVTALRSENMALVAAATSNLVALHREERLSPAMADQGTFVYLSKGNALALASIIPALNSVGVEPRELHSMAAGYRLRLGVLGVEKAVIAMQQGLGTLLSRAFSYASAETAGKFQDGAMLKGLDGISVAIARLALHPDFFFYARQFTAVFLDTDAVRVYLAGVIQALPAGDPVRKNAESLSASLERQQSDLIELPTTQRATTIALLEGGAFEVARTDDLLSPVQLHFPGVLPGEGGLALALDASVRSLARELITAAAGKAPFNVELIGVPRAAAK